MTPDSVVRVFMPVIDSPNHLQLHAALDRWAFTAGDPEPSSSDDTDADRGSRTKSEPTPIFWLDRSVFLSGSAHFHETPAASELEESRRRKVKELIEDDWELFAFVSRDGSLIVRALTV